MTVTAETISDSMIEQLRALASEAEDERVVALCNDALPGNEHRFRPAVRMIFRARCAALWNARNTTAIDKTREP